MAFLWKLFTLIAVLFLPFGMGSAHATFVHRAPMAKMPMGHCPDQPVSHGSSDGTAACTMACAAALPACETPAAQELGFAATLQSALPVPTLRGLIPDIATPPPKHA